MDISRQITKYSCLPFLMEKITIYTYRKAVLIMKNKKYLFTFEWEKGCVNDYIRKFLKENKIDYFYQYQQIVADLYGIGQYFKFDYEHINGNTYGIIATENI